MLDTLKLARIATVPDPLKFTHALALPLITVSDGTDEEPVWLDMVVSLSVLIGKPPHLQS
jgi:hypothetical protein